jgi:hypothetical protein
VLKAHPEILRKNILCASMSFGICFSPWSCFAELDRDQSLFAGSFSTFNTIDSRSCCSKFKKSLSSAVVGFAICLCYEKLVSVGKLGHGICYVSIFLLFSFCD